jgi:hypothetical protein
MQSINFVTQADENSASTRFRIHNPYELLKDNFNITISKFVQPGFDFYVFSKHYDPVGTLQQMYVARNLGNNPTLVFDVCDDHFDREYGDFYRNACDKADILTCTNKRMENRLKHLFPEKRVKVFHDPVNTFGGGPKWSKVPRIIWFGSVTNIKSVLPWLNEIGELTPYKVDIFSDGVIQGHKAVNQCIPFQPGWLEKNLKTYNICLLPTDKDPYVEMKSDNRCVDAINAGCYVVMKDDALLYSDFRDVVYRTNNNLRRMEIFFDYYSDSKHEEEIKDLIGRGQDIVYNLYNKKITKQQLLEVFNKDGNNTSN